MELHEKLKAVREALGEAQQEFAARFDVSQGYYSRWESGDRKPSRSARALIKRVFDEIYQQLMEGQNDKRVVGGKRQLAKTMRG